MKLCSTGWMCDNYRVAALLKGIWKDLLHNPGEVPCKSSWSCDSIKEIRLITNDVPWPYIISSVAKKKKKKWLQGFGIRIVKTSLSHLNDTCKWPQSACSVTSGLQWVGPDWSACTQMHEIFLSAAMSYSTINPGGLHWLWAPPPVCQGCGPTSCCCYRQTWE